MRLLFVCSGNTCRSPMAEVIARQEAIARGLSNIEISSAGTGAWDGAPSSDGALLVAMERHLDLGSHRARQLTPAILAESDLVLAMGPQHLEHIVALGGAEKAHLLTDFAAGAPTARAIADPYGGDLEGYRETFEELQAEIRRVFDRLVATRQPPAT